MMEEERFEMEWGIKIIKMSPGPGIKTGTTAWQIDTATEAVSPSN